MVVFTFWREERVTIVRILSAGDKIDQILIKCKYFVLFHDHLYSACSYNKFANDMWIIIFFVLTPHCSSIFCKLWDHFVFTGLTTVSSVLNDLVMSTCRVRSVSKGCLLLLGTWSHLYFFFRSPCCSAMYFYFALIIFEMVCGLLWLFIFRNKPGEYLYILHCTT